MNGLTRVLAVALAIVSIAASCSRSGQAIDDVARAFRMSEDDAARMVRAVADEVHLSEETAAARLLSQADAAFTVQSGQTELRLTIQKILDAAEADFEAAVASTFCEAALSFLVNGTADPNAIYSSLVANFGEAVANRVANAGEIADAIEFAQAAAAGDDAEVTLAALTFNC